MMRELGLSPSFRMLEGKIYCDCSYDWWLVCDELGEPQHFWSTRVSSIDMEFKMRVEVFDLLLFPHVSMKAVGVIGLWS